MEYDNADGDPRPGVPPESIWVTYGTTNGNVAVNDQEPTKVYAEYFTDANGVARITFPSLSGSGTLQVNLYVSGVHQGAKNVQIRSTDVDADADRRTTASDSTTGVDRAAA